MAKGKSQQVSFREKLPEYERIAAFARAEDLTLADFVRKVFRIEFKKYQEAGSLQALRQITCSGPSHKERQPRPRRRSRTT